MPVDDESCLRICIAASKIQRHYLTISSTIDMRIKQALPMQTCGKSVTALHVSIRMGSRPGCRSVSSVDSWLPPPLIATNSLFALKVRLAVLSCGSIQHRTYRVQRGSAWPQT